MAELFPLKMYFYCLKIKVTDLEMLSFDQSFLKVNNFFNARVEVDYICTDDRCLFPRFQ